MFTKPYGALTEEDFDYKIMTELQMQPIEDSDDDWNPKPTLKRAELKVSDHVGTQEKYSSSEYFPTIVDNETQKEKATKTEKVYCT